MPIFSGTDLGSGYYDAGTGGIQAPFIGPSAGNTYTQADLEKINQVLFGGQLTPLQMQYYTGQPNVWTTLYQTPQAQAYLASQVPANGGAPQGLTPGGDPMTSFTNTSPVQQPVQAPGATTTPAATGGDLRSQLAAVYAQAGLDPNNPGLGNLADINYFLQRAQQTNPNDIGYWTQRLQQEIQYQKTGQVGSLLDTGGGGGGGGGYGGTYGSMPSYQMNLGAMPQIPKAPNFSFAPWTQTFQAPSAADETNDPGYAERLQQGLDATQQSAAAQGTLLTTGTQRALDRYAQDYASNEYANVYNRALTGYQQNYQQYLNAYNQALQTYGTNYQGQLNNYNMALGQYQLQAQLGQQQFQNAFAEYQQQYGEGQNAYTNYTNALNTYWNQNMGLYNAGLTAAGGMNNAAGAYGSNAGNLYTGIGNVNAAAGLAGSNAYGSALTGLGNAALAYGLYGSGSLYASPRSSPSQTPYSNYTVPGVGGLR